MSLRRRNRANRPRREEVRRRPLPWRGIVSAVIGVTAFGLLLGGLARLLDRPVAIEVAGAGQRVSTLEVRAALREFEGAGFLSADLDVVRAAVEALPWVDRARVQRAFPARLKVTITEQVAAARWGERGLLNTRGELFVEHSRFPLPELPLLDGPEGSEWRVAQRYLEVHGLVTPLGFSVSALRMNARGAWDLAFANGLLVHLGRRAIGERLRRFAGVAARRVQELEARVAYVDMRYSNGFVIGWKSGYAPGDNRQAMQGPI